MAFELKQVVPWGRNLSEYRSMFSLTDSDLDKKIISFGDGPASFNSEMAEQGKYVTSIDPVYRFSANELKKRIRETKDLVIEQTKKNPGNFIWTKIKDIHELEHIRTSAMAHFLEDFESGKKAGRYIDHEMPFKTDFEDLTFDLGLSSHFLILYSRLGLEFHKASMTEMLRVSREIRIFPLLNLDAKRPALLDELREHFEKKFIVRTEKVDYEFQKGGDEMLVIKRK